MFWPKLSMGQTSQSLLSTYMLTQHTYFLATLPSWLSVYLSQAQSYSSPAPLCALWWQRRGEFSATRKRNKTIESVRQCRSNGFTTASSPPLLIMRKSIHRVLIVLFMRDGYSLKWAWKKTKNFSHTCIVGTKQLRGMCWISIVFNIKNGANVSVWHCKAALFVGLFFLLQKLKLASIRIVCLTP